MRTESLRLPMMLTLIAFFTTAAMYAQSGPAVGSGKALEQSASDTAGKCVSPDPVEVSLNRPAAVMNAVAVSRNQAPKGGFLRLSRYEFTKKKCERTPAWNLDERKIHANGVALASQNPPSEDDSSLIDANTGGTPGPEVR